MSKLRRFLAAILAAAMVSTVFSACGTAGSGTNSSGNSSGSGSDTSGHYPVTITTHNYAKEEVQITFEKAPEKVLAYNTNSVENMIALGLTDKIQLAFGFEEDEILPEYREEFKKIKSFQSEFPSKELAIAQQPDFILAWYSSFGDERLGDVDFWHERGINTYMAYNSGLGDQSLENEFQDILNLGKIFNVEDKAEALVAEMKAKVQKGREYVKDRDPVNISILEDEGDVFRIYGYDTIGGDIAKQVGANLVTPHQEGEKERRGIGVPQPRDDLQHPLRRGQLQPESRKLPGRLSEQPRVSEHRRREKRQNVPHGSEHGILPGRAGIPVPGLFPGASVSGFGHGLETRSIGN